MNILEGIQTLIKSDAFVMDENIGKISFFIETGDNLQAWQTIFGCFDLFLDKGIFTESDRLRVEGNAFGIGKEWEQPNMGDTFLAHQTSWQNGLRHGEELAWRDKDDMVLKAMWRNGVQHGLEEQWYCNGILSVERTWDNGQLHGVERTWYINGLPQMERTWEHGVLVGLERLWFPDGKLQHRYDRKPLIEQN